MTNARTDFDPGVFASVDLEPGSKTLTAPKIFAPTRSGRLWEVQI